MGRSLWYILRGKEPVPEPDSLVAAQFFEDFSKRCLAQHMLGDSRISTVFLGIDHNFGEGEPILFETLIEGGPKNDHMERYRTWDDAIAGHQRLLKELSHGHTPIAIEQPAPPNSPFPTVFDRLIEDPGVDDGNG